MNADGAFEGGSMSEICRCVRIIIPVTYYICVSCMFPGQDKGDLS